MLNLIYAHFEGHLNLGIWLAYFTINQRLTLWFRKSTAFRPWSTLWCESFFATSLRIFDQLTNIIWSFSLACLLSIKLLTSVPSLAFFRNYINNVFACNRNCWIRKFGVTGGNVLYVFCGNEHANFACSQK